MQKKFAIIILCILIAFGAGIAVITLLNYVPDNSPFTIGNTSGNLNNNGLFCEDDGLIYFSNCYDNDYLYSMNPDGSNCQLVLSSPVQYINSAGKYLYFYQDSNTDGEAFGNFVRNNGIYRYKKGSNSSPKCLDRTPAKLLSLVGNNLYYEHYNTKEGLRLYTVPIDRGKRREVLPKEINPACVIDGNIYFPDTDNNFYLSCFHPSNESYNIVIADMKIYQPVFDNGYIYYMNVSDNYSLYRYGISEDHVTKLTDCRIDTFNVYDGNVFYQKNGKDAALFRMNGDGSDPKEVLSGNYCDINMTANYTYFKAFEDPSTYYYTGTYQDTGVGTFMPKF